MSFPLVDNTRLKDAVEAFIAADRIPHAILIEGEKGTGRHTLAEYITEACICKGENPPCGVCESCHLAKVGSHPDIVYTVPEKQRKSIVVDQIRDLRQKIFTKAHISDRRVFIIDPADTMNPQSQNALLKVLEEPPAGVIFILITHSRDAMLETVISRCTVLSPAVPSEAEAVKYLRSVGNFSTDEIKSALKAASGRIGTSIEILNKNISDKAVATAQQFLDLLFQNKEMQLLELLHPFEKDRAGTDALLSALKAETAARLKITRLTSVKARILSKFYDQLCSYEGLLATNINLPLMSSALVCRATMLNNE